MNKWLQNIGDCLVPILFLVPVFLSTGDTQLQTKWVFTIIASMYSFCWLWVMPKFGMSVAALLFWLAAQSTYVWLWVDNRYANVKIYEQVHIRLFSVDSIAKVALVVIPLMVLIKSRSDALMKGKMLLALASIINIGFFLFDLLFSPTNFCTAANTCGGIMRNPSMNACLMACSIPLIRDLSTKSVSLVFMLWSLGYAVLVKSNMGIGMSIIAIFMVVGFDYGVRRALISAAILAIPTIAVASVYLQNKFLASSGRVFMWGKFMEALSFNSKGEFRFINVIPGMGFGTFGMFSHAIQKNTQKEMPHWWTWMHNDWLELIFTTGVIGFVLAVLVYLVALRRYIRDGFYFEAMALLLFGIYMTGNYPLHLAISSVFGVWLVGCALLRPREEMLLQS